MDVPVMAYCTEGVPVCVGFLVSTAKLGLGPDAETMTVTRKI